MSNFSLENRIFFKLPEKIETFQKLAWKIEFFVKLPDKDRKISEICLENRNFFDPDPRPPDFKPDLRR